MRRGKYLNLSGSQSCRTSLARSQFTASVVAALRQGTDVWLKALGRKSGDMSWLSGSHICHKRDELRPGATQKRWRKAALQKSGFAGGWTCHRQLERTEETGVKREWNLRDSEHQRSPRWAAIRTGAPQSLVWKGIFGTWEEDELQLAEDQIRSLECPGQSHRNVWLTGWGRLRLVSREHAAHRGGRTEQSVAPRPAASRHLQTLLKC